MAVRTQRRHAPVYVIPGGHPGMLKAGTIDLTRRPVVRLRNGSIATVRSISFSITEAELMRRFKLPLGRRSAEVLCPTVVGDRIVSERAAADRAIRTGLHLGIFDTPAHATQYAIRLHNWQAQYYRKFIKRKR